MSKQHTIEQSEIGAGITPGQRLEPLMMLCGYTNDALAKNMLHTNAELRDAACGAFYAVTGAAMDAKHLTKRWGVSYASGEPLPAGATKDVAALMNAVDLSSRLVDALIAQLLKLPPS